MVQERVLVQGLQTRIFVQRLQRLCIDGFLWNACYRPCRARSVRPLSGVKVVSIGVSGDPEAKLSYEYPAYLGGLPISRRIQHGLRRLTVY